METQNGLTLLHIHASDNDTDSSESNTIPSPTTDTSTDHCADKLDSTADPLDPYIPKPTPRPNRNTTVDTSNTHDMTPQSTNTDDDPDMDMDSDETSIFLEPDYPKTANISATKERISSTNSEWNTDPWIPVTSKSRKKKNKPSQSDDEISPQTPANSSTDHSMKDSDNDSASSFAEILNQLHNHSTPKPTQLKTKTSHTILAKTTISPNTPAKTDTTTLENTTMDTTPDFPQPTHPPKPPPATYDSDTSTCSIDEIIAEARSSLQQYCQSNNFARVQLTWKDTIHPDSTIRSPDIIAQASDKATTAQHPLNWWNQRPFAVGNNSVLFLFCFRNRMMRVRTV